MKRTGVFFLALIFITRGLGTAVDTFDSARATSIEVQVADNQPSRQWDMDQLLALSRALPSMDDFAAAGMLWSVAMTSPNVDTSTLFSSAMNSPSSVVKSIAATILVRDNNAVSRRLVINLLRSEIDSDTVWAVVQAYAHLPRNQAVSSLMNVMLTNGIPETTLRDVAQELRRITRTELPDEPGAWRDWWLDNEDFYSH